MIRLFIYSVDGERSYAIESPDPKEVVKFNQQFGHDGCDYQLEVDNRDLEYDEIEKWFAENSDE